MISLAEGGIHNVLNVIQVFRNLRMLPACWQARGSVKHKNCFKEIWTGKAFGRL